MNQRALPAPPRTSPGGGRRFFRIPTPQGRNGSSPGSSEVDDEREGSLFPRSVGGDEFLSLSLSLSLLASAAWGRTAAPQAPLEPDEEPYKIIAYVDPAYGNDTTARVSNPDKPFRKLQAAIDAAQAELSSVSGGNPVALGMDATVVALEGVYGPKGPSPANGEFASGDSFPIRMRDRVHVKGVGARRCILRGVRTGDVNTAGTTSVFWPSAPSADGDATERSTASEVLLDLSQTNIAHAPWFAQNTRNDDLIEVFDSFTFQSGDVQVLVTSGYDTAHLGEPKAIVANCIFDMRHGYSVAAAVEPPPPQQPVPTRAVSGPTFGVLMVQAYVPYGGSGGYVDQKVLITQNTFVMAHYTPTGWQHGCLPNAVGVMNVNDPGCPTPGNSAWIDCDRTLYGMANCGVVANLFRTPHERLTTTPPPFPFAMLGIDDGDTRARGHSGDALQEGNAFGNSLAYKQNDAGLGAPHHVPWTGPGAGFTCFYSEPVPAAPLSLQPAGGPVLYHPCASAQWLPPSGNWDCSAACSSSTCSVTPYTSYPSDNRVFFEQHNPGGGSVVHGDDPRFVGEYLSATHTAIVGAECVDWRLLPGSPLAAASSGLRLESDRTIVTANGSSWPLLTIRDADPFQWDGEGYGNRRFVETRAEPGFDELHYFLMAGSYANDSNSHNAAGALNPSVANAQPGRFWITRQSSAAGANGITWGQGDKARVYYSAVAPTSTPPKPAWYQPIGTLPDPITGTGLPVNLRTKYITFSSMWEVSWQQPNNVNYRPFYLPASLPLTPLTEFYWPDDECPPSGPCANEWFNTQLVLYRDPDEKLWSNLQSEYR